MSKDDCCGSRPHRAGCPNETPLFTCDACATDYFDKKDRRDLREKHVCRECYIADCIDEAIDKIIARAIPKTTVLPLSTMREMRGSFCAVIRSAVDEILAQEK
jgi:hypothetical protein